MVRKEGTATPGVGVGLQEVGVETVPDVDIRETLAQTEDGSGWDAPEVSEETRVDGTLIGRRCM